MAESVDALVSNTSGATRAGSTPALGTLENANPLKITWLAFFLIIKLATFWRDRCRYDLFVWLFAVSYCEVVSVQCSLTGCLNDLNG